MKLKLLTSLFLLAQLSLQHAAFDQVRTNIKWDHSNPDPDPAKYFNEANFHSHYDGRFADQQLPYAVKRKRLTALIQTYLSAMNDIGIETFIMHGSLLGWYWNRKILPWDDDIDVMTTETGMRHLARGYNMTMYHFRLPNFDEGKKSTYYMLEINPHSSNGTTLDPANIIDARWIDTDTGLYIDITTLRRNHTATSLGDERNMYVKDNHTYAFDNIFPLRGSTFEGVPVKVPFAYADLLVEEYGPNALVETQFMEHKFDAVRGEWVAQGIVVRPAAHPKFQGKGDVGDEAGFWEGVREALGWG